jgi:hypothetical protein
MQILHETAQNKTMGNKISVTKRVVRMRSEWNWLCIISYPAMGFHIGGAEIQGSITCVYWLIRKNGEAGSYSPFQNNNITLMKHPNRLIYSHIFNKDVTNVETRLLSEYTFIHKIKSIMQDKNLNTRAKPVTSTIHYLNRHYRLARFKYLDKRAFLRYCFTCLRLPAATSPTKRETVSDA